MSLCTKKFVLVYSNCLEFKLSLGYADQSFGLETYQGDRLRYFSDVPIVDSSFRRHLINFTRTSDVCVTLTISAQKVLVFCNWTFASENLIFFLQIVLNSGLITRRFAKNLSPDLLIIDIMNFLI